MFLARRGHLHLVGEFSSCWKCNAIRHLKVIQKQASETDPPCRSSKRCPSRDVSRDDHGWRGRYEHAVRGVWGCGVPREAGCAAGATLWVHGASVRCGHGAGVRQCAVLPARAGAVQTQDAFLGRPQQPASLHRYIYGHQNPQRYVDPDGQSATVVGAGVNNHLKVIHFQSSESDPGQIG